MLWPRDGLRLSHEKEGNTFYVLSVGRSSKICLTKPDRKDYILTDSTCVNCPEQANLWRSPGSGAVVARHWAWERGLTRNGHDGSPEGWGLSEPRFWS